MFNKSVYIILFSIFKLFPSNPDVAAYFDSGTRCYEPSVSAITFNKKFTIDGKTVINQNFCHDEAKATKTPNFCDQCATLGSALSYTTCGSDIKILREDCGMLCQANINCISAILVNQLQLFSSTFSSFYQAYLIAQNKFNDDQKALVLDKTGLRSVLDSTKEWVEQQLISKIKKMQPNQSRAKIKDWVKRNFKDAFAQYSGSKASFDLFFTDILKKITNIQSVDEVTSKIQKGLGSYNDLDKNQKRFAIPVLMNLNEAIISKDNTSALALKKSLVDLSNFLTGRGELPITFKFCTNDKLNAIDYLNKLIKLFAGKVTSGCDGFNINQDILKSISRTYEQDVIKILNNVMSKKQNSSKDNFSLPTIDISSIDYKIFGLSDPTLVLPKNLYIKNYLEICEIISGFISAGSPLITILANYIKEYAKYCKECGSSYDKMMGLGFAQAMAEMGSFIGIEKAFESLEVSIKRYFKDRANTIKSDAKPGETTAKTGESAAKPKPNIASDSKLSGEKSGYKAGLKSAANNEVDKKIIREASKKASEAATNKSLSFVDDRFAQASAKGFKESSKLVFKKPLNYPKGGLDREAIDLMTANSKSAASDAAYKHLIDNKVDPTEARKIADDISKKAADSSVNETQKLVRKMNKASENILSEAKKALPGNPELAKVISDSAREAATKAAASGGTKTEIMKASEEAAEKAAKEWKKGVKLNAPSDTGIQKSIRDITKVVEQEVSAINAGKAGLQSQVEASVVAREAAEEAAEKLAKKATTEAVETAAEKLAKEAAEKLAKKATTEVVETAAQKAAKEVFKAAAKKGAEVSANFAAKEAAKEVFKTAAKVGAEVSANFAAKATAKAAAKAAQTLAIKGAAKLSAEAALKGAATSNPITGAVMLAYQVGSTICGAVLGVKSPEDAKYCDPIAMIISADAHLCSKANEAFGGGDEASKSENYKAKAITYATNPSCLALDSLSNLMTNVIAKAPDMIGGFFSSICNIGMSVAQGNMKGAGEMVGQTAQNYNKATLLLNATTSISPYGETVIPEGTWANASQSSDSFCSGAGAWISGAITDVVSWVATAMGDIIGGLGTFLTGGYNDKIENFFEGKYNKTMLANLTEFVSSEYWNTIGQRIKTFFTETFDGRPGEFCTDWLKRKGQCRGCSTGEVVNWSATGGVCPWGYVLNYGCGCGCMKVFWASCPSCTCNN